eukprot:3288865-Prymnesium_polylepis.1
MQEKILKFEGTWKLTSLEGDMGAVLKAAKVPWPIRQAARAVGYGVNKDCEVTPSIRSSAPPCPCCARGEHISLKTNAAHRRFPSPSATM